MVKKSEGRQAQTVDEDTFSQPTNAVSGTSFECQDKLDLNQL